MSDPESRHIPDRAEVLEMAAGSMPACVIGAAAELNVWTLLDGGPLTADDMASRLRADRRATTMLLDAVAALGLIEKRGSEYALPDTVRPWLTDGPDGSILPMLRHRMAMIRSGSQLAWTVRAGIPAPRTTGVRGTTAEREAFIAAMHAVNVEAADGLVARLGPPEFRHLLDVGGASGTWTLAFLRARPEARATIFDLPDAIAQARTRVQSEPEGDRIALVAGDFYADPLPGGADFAWVSAIAHQHSREDNRRLLRKVFDALEPGGRVAIRDIVMQSDRTTPVGGALFAINMLVNTETGGTFTFDEFAADLTAAGFEQPELAVDDAGMNSVVIATRQTS